MRSKESKLSPTSGDKVKEAAFWIGGIVCVMALLRGCGAVAEEKYSANDAKLYLEDSGYTDATLTDTDYMFIQLTGCGEDDSVKYEFQATGASGREVEIDVCVGVFKGASIRD